MAKKNDTGLPGETSFEQELDAQDTPTVPDVPRADPFKGVSDVPLPATVGDLGMPEAEDGEFSFEFDDKPILPVGFYPAICTDLENVPSKGTGNPQYVWTFKVVGPEEHRGKTIKAFTSLVPAARWKVAETARAHGVVPVNGQITFKRSDVVDKLVRLEIIIDTYTGREQSKVNKVLPAKPEDQEALRTLEALPE